MLNASPFDVPQGVFEVGFLCGKLADQLSDDFYQPSNVSPISGLSMAFNTLTQCFELLDYYYHRWGRVEPDLVLQHGSERLLDENEQRLALIQKSTLVLVLSAFEAVAKQAISERGSPIKYSGKRVYLGGIMAQSHKQGLIDGDDAYLWSFVIALRNCIVHNNGVADRAVQIDLGNGYEFAMNDGHMTESTPRKSTILLRLVVEAYARWCRAFLENARA